MKGAYIIAGAALFLLSSVLADFISGSGVSLSIGGRDYAPELIKKVLDVLAGSLLVWGILDFKKGRR